MMRVIILLIGTILMAGCSQEKGPLAKLNSFSVMSCYQDEHAYSFLTRELEKLGKVERGENPRAPILLIALSDVPSPNSGSAQVICDVKVMKNGFRTACPVWSTSYSGSSIATPVLNQGKVSFEEQSSQKSGSTEEAIKQLVHDFLSAYEKDNPHGNRPTFYLPAKSF